MGASFAQSIASYQQLIKLVRIRAGAYRLFGFEAVHIAAILNELTRYGVQTAGLKQVAHLLWQVVAACSQHPDVTEDVRHEAAALHRAQRRYSDRSSHSSEEEDFEDDYDSYEDWLEVRGPVSGKAIEIAPWFDEGADLSFGLYLDLFTPAIFDEFDTRWIFTHAGGQLIAVPEDLELESLDLGKVRSYIMINLSLIIRPIWMLQTA